MLTHISYRTAAPTFSANPAHLANNPARKITIVPPPAAFQPDIFLVKLPHPAAATNRRAHKTATHTKPPYTRKHNAHKKHNIAKQPFGALQTRAFGKRAQSFAKQPKGYFGTRHGVRKRVVMIA